MVIYTGILASPEEQAHVVRYYLDQAADIYRVIKHFMRNPEDVNDLYQEVFVRIMKNPEPFFRMELESPQALRSYLLKTTRNACIDELKRRKKERNDICLDDMPDLPSPVEVDTSCICSMQFQQAIRFLRAPEQEILFLHMEFGESLRDIAKAKGAAESTVGSCFRRAKGKIAKMIQEADLDEASK